MDSRHASMMVVFALACREDPDRSALRARVGALSVETTRDQERLREVRDNLNQIQRWITRLSAELRETEARFVRAGGTFDGAASSSQNAALQGERAIETLRAAERAYRASSALIIAAAAADFAGHQLCEGAMSTSRYRRELRARGVDLDGMDIDHLWPHSRGGANHPLNYQPTELSLNRSMGNDIAVKFAHQPIGVLRGLAVSALMRLQCASDPRAFGR